MTHYRAGRLVEHRNREHLESEGYEVMRAAGSKGKRDLDAIKPGQQLFVQCKTLDTGLSRKDWDRLIELSRWVGAVPILGTRDTVRGCQEKHSSVKCGTVLWRLTGLYLPRQSFALQLAELFVTDELTGSPDGPGGTGVTPSGATRAKESAVLDSREGADRTAQADGVLPAEGGAQ